MELFRVIVLTLCLPFSLQPPLSAAFPSSLCCPVSKDHPAFAGLPVLFGCPTTRQALLPTSLFAYKVAYPDSCQEPDEFSWGHAQIFHTVPSANTLVRWVNENAFAPVVRARPCPTFGRPVHLRGSPHRLRPGTSPHAFRIPPRDGHPALRKTARKWLQVRLGCLQLSPSCPFRRLRTCLLSPASEALPPLSDMAPLIRAPEGLQPS